MLKNYIKVAWRNLKKQPFFTFLNVFGLAIGITGVLLISLYIYDELSYDSMFTDADRIYRVNADIKFGGERYNTAEVSAPMAEAILHDISQVEQVARFRNWGSTLIREQGMTSNVKEELTTYADSTMFSMLGLKLLYGDTHTALTAPNTLVLSKTAAEKLFPVDQALGKTVILNDNETYTVTGVIDDLPKNSFLRERSLFLSMAGYQDSREKLWGNHNYYTLIKLIPGAKPEDIQATLQGMVGKYVIPYVQRFFPGMTEQQFIDSGNFLKFSTIALQDIHLHSQREPEFSANGDIKNIYILAIIGIFLIVLASVNFMNLSTAQSLKRAKEVGIRKTLGSEKSGLIKQFLIESAMLTFGALILAILLSLAILPFFNDLAAKELYI
ncbi:MAG: ABC transporter permease, partial [Flavobacteriaceae bacterium]|nr:ABC transporter permease [Flavobacteriaceae bacterium]